MIRFYTKHACDRRTEDGRNWRGIYTL